jgi:hypothetical protein
MIYCCNTLPGFILQSWYEFPSFFCSVILRCSLVSCSFFFTQPQSKDRLKTHWWATGLFHIGIASEASIYICSQGTTRFKGPQQLLPTYPFLNALIYRFSQNLPSDMLGSLWSQGGEVGLDWFVLVVSSRMVCLRLSPPRFSDRRSRPKKDHSHRI